MTIAVAKPDYDKFTFGIQNGLPVNFAVVIAYIYSFHIISLFQINDLTALSDHEQT